MELQSPGDLEQYPEHYTLGYWLGREFAGYGYAYEATSAVLNRAFTDMNSPAVAARVFKSNTASFRLLTRLGYKKTGECLRFSKSLNEDVENYVGLITKERFFAAQYEQNKGKVRQDPNNPPPVNTDLELSEE
ncbi:GNAT family N-acetyltransferase [Flexibacterium corallicola]|uniref:GNAT family N-acetyltransferase n=1 Tax=Flexibacterium corallicola TaxID=3037259 RepID=UPI00286F801F|nr:GNAT family N-acetyltransferase [Pseudovibrio sp. M1P-2-3]